MLELTGNLWDYHKEDGDGRVRARQERSMKHCSGMRQAGFYRVYSSWRRAWVIAQWTGDGWFSCGDSHLLPDSTWEKIGQRIDFDA